MLNLDVLVEIYLLKRKIMLIHDI